MNQNRRNMERIIKDLTSMTDNKETLLSAGDITGGTDLSLA